MKKILVKTLFAVLMLYGLSMFWTYAGAYICGHLSAVQLVALLGSCLISLTIAILIGSRAD